MQNKLGNRQQAVFIYSFLFAYVLSFIFEGRVYYQLMEQMNYSFPIQNILTMFLHMIGLLFAAFFIKDMKKIRKIMVIAIAICIICSPLFLISNVYAGNVVLSITAVSSGIAVASWGAFYKHYIPTKERLKSMADALILANLLMILAGAIATYVSVLLGFVLTILYLIVAVFILLTGNDDALADVKLSSADMFIKGNGRTWILFFSFITIVTIDSGLMYGVVTMKYQQLDWLATWYWAVPYVLILFVMKICSKNKSGSRYLYLAIAMISIGFVCFRFTDVSVKSYILIDTLLLAGSAILDLFWSSIVGEAMDGTNHPVRVLGIGWSANVCGVLIGSLISQSIIQLKLEDADVTIIALMIICATLVVLHEMISHLRILLKNNMYLSQFVEAPKEIQHQVVNELTRQVVHGEVLTVRENEILELILQGQTNKIIAESLSISENTVKTHVRSILSKFYVDNRTQLISLILQNVK